MTKAAAPNARRIIRTLSLAVALAAAVLFAGTKPALAEPVATAQALADALNAATPDTPVATVSADGSTVTLAASATVTGDDPIDVAVPAGQSLTLDLGAHTLTLENGATTAPAQLTITGEGAFTITADEDGSLVSKTADGIVHSIEVTSAALTLDAPLTVATPLADQTVDEHQQTYGSAVLVTGGSLTLADSSGISGDGGGTTALLEMTNGELSMEGGTIHTENPYMADVLVFGGTAELSSGVIESTDENFCFAVVSGRTGDVTISGDIYVIGWVMAQFGGNVTVTGGSVINSLQAQDGGTATLMPTPEDVVPPEFSSPVPLECLDEGIHYAEYDFTGSEPAGAFLYFASEEAAEADASQYPGASVATVTEDGYICGMFYADDAESANEYYTNFFDMVAVEKPDQTFKGPQMIVLAAMRKGMEGTFNCTLGDRLLDSEHFTVVDDGVHTSWLQMFFDICQPEDPVEGLPQIGMGECAVELVNSSDPSDVYTSSSVAISKVTLDPAGGTMPEGASNIRYNVQGFWEMVAPPERPGYKLASWTTAPTEDLIYWSDVWDGWVYEMPQGPEAFTFTAQWEPETVDVHRLWMPESGAHLLTSDPNEVQVLTTQYGWKDDGAAFTAYIGPVGGSVPVTRLLNPTNGDHLYTTSATEVRGLEAIGWQSEGVKFYGSADTTYPVYRLWNSYQTADGGLGSHLWTSGFNEYVILPQLPPVGAWQPEGVAWYAVGLPD